MPYNVWLDDSEHQTLLEVILETGRKHQIRGQLVHLGYPICGDKKYGAKQAFRTKDIALHAYYLAFQHPVIKQPVRYAILSLLS